MKKIILIITLIFSSIFVNAQDIIYKSDGTEIFCQVEEVDEAILKVIIYRDLKNLNGPVRKILISEVFLIKYENGIIEKFKQKPQPLQTQTQPIVEESKEEPPPAEDQKKVFKQQNPQPSPTENIFSPKKECFLLNTGGALHIPFDEDIAEVVGSMFLIGAGMGMDLGNIFINAMLYSGTSQYDENWKFTHTQVSGLLGIKWGGKTNPNFAQVYTGIGVAYVVLTDKSIGSKETGNGIGGLLELGVDISLGKNTFLFLASTSIYGSLIFYDEKISIASEQLRFGLKYKL